jgi:hypothetical protein|tara:strand:- start:448 stop:1044 length:597 start_codon:yes stop_codon:yes gene_type:complete
LQVVNKKTWEKKMNDITKLFEDVSTESFNKIDDEALGQLGSEIERIRSVQEQLELTEVKIKQLKEEEQVLADSITDLLQSKGVSELKLIDGSKVTTKEQLYCSIKEDNKEGAFNWVRSQGDGDIIKNIVSVDFKKGEDEVAQEFKQLAEDSGLVPNETSSIHPSTLRSYLNAKSRDGVDFDEKLFGAFRLNKVSIKQS